MSVSHLLVENKFDIYGKNLQLCGTIDATGFNSGAVQISGGCSISKTLYANIAHIADTLTCPNIIYEDVDYVESTIDSTSTSTGALRVVGGTGIGKNLFAGGVINGGSLYSNSSITALEETTSATLNINGNIASTNTSTGSIKCLGGIGVNGNINMRGICSCDNDGNTQYRCTNDDYISSWGVDSSGETYLSNNGYNMYISTPERVILTSTLDAINASNAGVIMQGGLGIAKKTYCNGSLTINNTTDSTNSITGSVVISGGVGIAKTLHVGETIYGNSLHSDSSITATGDISSSTLNITGNIASTNTSTGSIKCLGGMGLNGNINMRGICSCDNDGNTQYRCTNDDYISTWGVDSSGETYLSNNGYNMYISTPERLTLSSTLEASSYSNAGVIIQGGLGIAKKTYCNGSLIINNTTNSTSPTTGALIVSGGLGVRRNVNITGDTNIYSTSTSQLTVGYDFSNYAYLNVNSAGELTIHNTGIACVINKDLICDATTNSTSTNTGSLTVSGGAGIGKNLYVGGNKTIVGNTIYVPGAFTIPSGSGPFNNVSMGNPATNIIMTNNANAESHITGFVAGGGTNENGAIVRIYCPAGNPIYIDHNSSSSSDANRLTLMDGIDRRMTPPFSFSIGYTTTTNKWIMYSYLP